MFRQIVASITLAALTLWTIGCSKTVTVPAEQAVKEKQLKRQTPSTVEPISLKLQDGMVLEFDSAGCAYSPKIRTFSGRSPDGRVIDVSTHLVREVSMKKVDSCIVRQEVADVRTFEGYFKKQHKAVALSVGCHPVTALMLTDSSVIRFDMSGITYDCTDSTWVGQRKNGEPLTVKQGDIRAYMYRALDLGKTTLLGLGIAVVLGIVFLAIAFGSLGPMGISAQ